MADERTRETPPSQDTENVQAERDVMGLMQEILRDEGADEFWNRLYNRTEKSLAMVSDLNRAELVDRLLSLWFAETFEQPWLADLVDWDLALRASLKRKGREEAVQAMTGNAEQRARGFMRLKRLLG